MDPGLLGWVTDTFSSMRDKGDTPPPSGGRLRSGGGEMSQA